MADGAAALLLLLLCLLCTVFCGLGQSQEIQLSNATDARLSSVYTTYGAEGLEYYGPLEINFGNSTWIRIVWPNEQISEQTGNVICRSLGYGPYRTAWYDYYNYYYSSTSSINLAAARCNGREPAISSCSLDPNQPATVNSYLYTNIRCAESRCASTNRSCSQICLNNPPTSDQICDCRQGYSLSPESPTECVDIDECSMNNGGCAFSCINTVGSYACTCPVFSTIGNSSGGCAVTGFKLTCGSTSMTVAFLKQAYPMLQPDEVTLLGNDCAPSQNETHITLSTTYDSCMTEQAEDERGIIYSNAVVSSGSEHKSTEAVFAATINIPFHCVVRRQSESAISVKNTPSTLITSPVNLGTANFRIRLFLDSAYIWALGTTQIKQGSLIYALLDLDAGDSDLKFVVRRCSVRANGFTDGERIDLIRDGRPATQWVRIINSTGEQSFKFYYPAFTLIGGNGALTMECQAELKTSASSLSVLSPTAAAIINASTLGPLFSTRLSVNASATSPQAQTTTYASTPRTTTRALGDSTKLPLISSCEEATTDGMHRLMLGRRLVLVWCDTTSPGGPWLTVMRRNNSGLNFNRSFSEYGAGFGSVDKEFWLGNAYLNEITRYHGATLRIELTNFANVYKFAEYSTAVVGDAYGGYNLTLGAYRGSAGDMRNTSGCLRNSFVSNAVKFSTYDADNDELADYKCAGRGGGWWYHDCACTCLTCGPSTSRQIMTRIGMTYYQFNGLFVLKKAEIKLRFGTLKSVYPDSTSTASSIVECDAQHLTLFLDKETFDGPSEENLAIHSTSLLNLSRNDAHIVLNFSLWSLDTSRQENATHITYTKLAVAETASTTAYYRRILMNPKCIFDKVISQEVAYDVTSYDMNFEITGGTNYDVKIIMAQDEAFTTLINTTAGVKEGSTIFVKVIPVGQPNDIRLAFSSCNLSGASLPTANYPILDKRCALHDDVNIINRDAFVMRLPSFALDDLGTRVACNIQVCSSNDNTCDSGCDNQIISNDQLDLGSTVTTTATVWWKR